METEQTPYQKKLLDPRWQKKRLEVFEFDNWTCVFCASKEKTLHAHHLHYVRGREPWEYTSLEIVTLCETCHKYEHTKELREGYTQLLIDCLNSLTMHDLLELGCVITNNYGTGQQALDDRMHRWNQWAREQKKNGRKEFV